MIKVGIIGYGNLGRAVEEEVLKSKNMKLVAIFSRRVVVSKFHSLIEPYDEYKNYVKKIDIMIMCGSSANDIEWQLPEISKYFDSINSFDAHSKIKNLIRQVDVINKKSKTISISACGWDPGLFSSIRVMMYLISSEKPITFWGKGISMGHSDAIRKLNDVIDAVQFTIPKLEAIKNAKKGKTELELSNNFHKRLCFVCSNVQNKNKLETQIKNIPNYFKNQNTSVSFVSIEHLSKLKSKMSHKGRIICPFKIGAKKKAYLEFVAKMDSNPVFTAKIMISYLNAVIKFREFENYGAFLPIDVPLSFLLSQRQQQFFFKNLC